MQTLVKVVILFITTVVFSQSIDKTVGEFTELKVYDLIEVELIKAKEDKVVITGKNKDAVLVNNKNGTLKIKMKLEETFDGNTTRVKLYYTKIDVIDVNEGAKVISNDAIEQFEIDLNAQEGGKIDVKLNVTYTNIRSVTGAHIKAYGKTEHQDISIYTGGVFHGEALKSQNTDVSIRIAGEAHVNAKKMVNAKVRAGGTISIYGNPKRIEKSKVLGGKIRVVK